MTTSPAHSAAAVENLLSALAGIRSARVVTAADGDIDEIHILCEPALQPKQVVRNIESALSAGLGLHIDRRIVSVAQLRDTAAEDADVATAAPPATDSYAAPPLASPQPAPLPRFAFVGFDARQHAGGTDCRATVSRARRLFEGTATGPNTTQGRASAAAEALINAVASADASSIGLDGVALAELGGQTFVMVCAHATSGRHAASLTGVAALRRSPEDAAILAALQAVNRWVELQ